MPSDSFERPALGIVGGLGGLASAEFLRTIYEENACEVESEGPICFLRSDPTFPDRTRAILDNDDRGISGRLAESLRSLIDLGATKTVLCCVTLHHFLPDVDSSLTSRNVSLVDLIFEGVKGSSERHLVLGTTGSKAASVLARQPGWAEVEQFMVFPNDEEQAKLHAMLYQLKWGPVTDAHIAYLDGVRRAHGAARVIASCTEAHLIHKAVLRSPDAPRIGFQDPLMRLARGLKGYLADDGRLPREPAVRHSPNLELEPEYQ